MDKRQSFVSRLIGRLYKFLVKKAVNIADMRRYSKVLLPSPIFGYLDGGADDEVTLRRNSSDFGKYELLPRYLVDISSIDTTTHVMDSDLSFPVICSPTGMSRLFHAEGELAVAQAAAEIGTVYTLSTLSTFSIEDVAGVSKGDKWFQIYVFKDRSLISEFMDRCRDAGYKGLSLTIDVPTQGNRERDIRNGLAIPPSIGLRSAFGFLLKPMWCYDYLTSDRFQLANVSHKAPVDSRDLTTLIQYLEKQFDPTVDWEAASDMVSEWGGPFAIKGICSVQDALRAVEVGATTIVLSNHGGRQLDFAASPISLLPAVKKAVGNDVEIIVEGGVRRGTDILKALALGANACAVGRPYLYGLATGGKAGVSKALGLLKEEFSRSLALAGITKVNDINQSCLREYECKHDVAR